MGRKWLIVVALGGALAGFFSTEVFYRNKTIKKQSEYIDVLSRLVDAQDRYIDVLKRALDTGPEEDSEIITVYSGVQPVVSISRCKSDDDE